MSRVGAIFVERISERISRAKIYDSGKTDSFPPPLKKGNNVSSVARTPRVPSECSARGAIRVHGTFGFVERRTCNIFRGRIEDARSISRQETPSLAFNELRSTKREGGEGGCYFRQVRGSLACPFVPVLERVTALTRKCSTRTSTVLSKVLKGAPRFRECPMRRLDGEGRGDTRRKGHRLREVGVAVSVDKSVATFIVPTNMAQWGDGKKG